MAFNVKKEESFSKIMPVIKVVGVGGAGCNAVNRMVESGIDDVKFIAVNTDAQVLEVSKADEIVQIGEKLTKGLGAGGNPKVGEEAALEDKKKLEEILRGTDMLFITAGFGGGTGTGAAPVIAEIAKNLGILTVAVVTTPFYFEGDPRWKAAMQGIRKIHQHVDTLIKISNNKLLEEFSSDITFVDAFKKADETLYQGIKGISELITKRGIINLDFADIESVMRNAGAAMLGIGVGKGENRATIAARNALESKLVEHPIENANSIILNITASNSFKLHEMQEAAVIIRQTCSENADLKLGINVDPEMPEDEVRVTLIATGLEREEDFLYSQEDIPALFKFGLEVMGNDGKKV
ncbi:cell division protein FtsZ [Thermosipho affectus]|uniref:Cell division protein FtsZ n=1 Tax=Thermosipho affectus TaxID=660294 RepID=A0ABX3IHI3_9BACT|nr:MULTISPECIES: cell division protein FtsZ [Thermosipho]ANQ54190.1 cell division protein FtsZ [Thermosipho sp. 1070]APT72635.1 cell division protein FtsZ [Thermosipho sp. 1063]ONN26636.1 cell division protein FtsZ [Thermosipho affectus]OOC42033.1 cell division protein FtsZ [Thermosipho sp. 1074]